MKKEILIIVGDEKVFEIIRNALASEMVGASRAYTPEEGLYCMREHNYSLTIIDVAIYEQSG